MVVLVKLCKVELVVGEMVALERTFLRCLVPNNVAKPMIC
jgi:hypothetical protein